METQQPVVRHSKIGIASFVLALLGVASVLLFILMIGFNAFKLTGDILFTIPLVCLGFSFLPLFIGVGALFQKNTKKIFAVLGIIISCLLCLASIVPYLFLGAALLGLGQA